MPGSRLKMLYLPASFVWKVLVALVALSNNFTSAPGIAAPDSSVT